MLSICQMFPASFLSPPFFFCFEITHLLSLITLFLPSHVMTSTFTIFPSFSPFLCPFTLSPSSPSSCLLYLSSDLPAFPFLLLLLPFHSLPLPPLLPFIKCGWWLAGSCWLGSGGGYSFIIPPRLPARLATMSQELNICHYYLLVLFDFEAAQWPVSTGFIPPPSVVRFKVDYSNPRAPDSAKSWSFLSFAHSFFLSLNPPPRSTLLNEITYICWLRV